MRLLANRTSRAGARTRLLILVAIDFALEMAIAGTRRIKSASAWLAEVMP